MQNNLLKEKRGSGILAHITSLPSPYGIGDIGTSAISFLDFLEKSAQKFWQILPTGPTSRIFDSSPYMSTSAFAGSPLLISPDLLFEMGLISRSDLIPDQEFSPYLTQYGKVSKYKLKLLESAFVSHLASPVDNFESFCTSTCWLEDYALFMTCKNLYDGKAWFQWSSDIAHRNQSTLLSLKEKHNDIFSYYLFEQFIFHTQWQTLKKHASEKKISIIGDIPIYIGLDSSDVWSHQEIFEIDAKTLKPKHVSGVPPDYFSKTGQRWGNPIYRWNSKDIEIEKKLFSWWKERFKATFNLVDVARIDHFRGFESYWTVPEEEETAVKGSWSKGPGITFFERITQELGPLNIIAEDLGEITTEVIALRDALNFPGMKVLQFAFDGNPDNTFLPYNFETPFCVVYTGTHDNDTTLGWYFSEQLDDAKRNQIKQFSNKNIHDETGIHKDFIYLALSSIANLAIFPLQDLLGFGNDCRMNTPGVPTGNWRWRCAPEFLTDESASWLKEITKRFGR